jgi:hypothetical protein
MSDLGILPAHIGENIIRIESISKPLPRFVTGLISSLLHTRRIVSEGTTFHVIDLFTPSHFPFLNIFPNVCIFGGFIERLITRKLHIEDQTSVKSSDIDLIVRGNDANYACQVAIDLINYIQPRGEIIRSSNAVSFLAPLDNIFPFLDRDILSSIRVYKVKISDSLPLVNCVKIQIVNAKIPYSMDIGNDVFQFLNGIDLSCTRFVLSHQGLFGTESAINSITTRKCYLDRNCFDTTRIAKYYHRFYDFEIKGFESALELTIPAICCDVMKTIGTHAHTYSSQNDYVSFVKHLDEGGNNILMTQFIKNPDNVLFISGYKEDLGEIIRIGKQPIGTLNDWKFEALIYRNITAKTLAAGNDKDIKSLRCILARSIRRFNKHIIELNLGKMFMKDANAEHYDHIKWSPILKPPGNSREAVVDERYFMTCHGQQIENSTISSALSLQST